MMYAFVAIAGLIHIYIFLMESILWGKPRINKVFGMTKEMAEANRLFAFNQGFYNLFLAAAALSGIFFSLRGDVLIGVVLMFYACLSMLAASVVLLSSNRKLIRASLIQGIPPLLGLGILASKIFV